MNRANLLLLAALMLIMSVPACSAPTPTKPPESPTATNSPIPTGTFTLTPTATNTLPPPVASTNTPTATPSVRRFYVNGTVWHDLCKAVDGPVPTPIPSGCLFETGLGLFGNGIWDAGEPGIGGVLVRLDLNCTYGGYEITTDPNGFYSFSFTVDATIGITEQQICVTVDLSKPQNVNVLVPGEWTSLHPSSDGTAVIQTIALVDQTITVNFGWDYQFAP